MKKSLYRLLCLGLLATGSQAFAQKATLAVSYLNSNTNNPEASWISKGMADMLTTDLAKISSLTVVQREQLDKVLKEQALGASGAVDPGKAVQLGKLLGAQQLVSGSYAAIGRNVRVDLQVIDVQTGKINSGVSGEGSIDSIFTLEKQLVLTLINKLGITPTASEMQSIMQAETYNNQAVVLNYQGLSQLQSDPKAAAATLKQAVALDPNYQSAQKNLETAMNTSGESLANAALLGIKIAKTENEAAYAVAQLLMNSLVPSGVNFSNKPKVSGAGTQNAQLKFTYHWRLKEGTAQQVLTLLQPFDDPQSNNKLLILKSKGIGRNGQKELHISQEAYDIIAKYINIHKKFLLFMSDGPEPVMIGGSTNGFFIFNTGGIKLTVDQDFDTQEEVTTDYLPIDLIKNLKKTASVTAISQYSYSGQFKNETSISQSAPVTLLQIKPQDANELGLPIGVFRRGGNYDQCRDFARTSQEINEDFYSRADCSIFYKLNDGDFTVDKLREAIYSGQRFNISVYKTASKSKSVVKSLGLFVSLPEEKMYYGNYVVLEKLLIYREEKEFLFDQNGEINNVNLNFIR